MPRAQSADGKDPPRLFPRDAATLVVVDWQRAEPRILMGRRRPDLAFLPGKFVFPGGRVDAVDRRSAEGGELPRRVLEKLLVRMRGRASVSRAHAIGRAALRETTEETGLAFRDGGEGMLSRLDFVARAITPPGRVRRYDTRFFMVDASCLASAVLSGDGELVDLDWFPLANIRSLDLPGITRLVIEDVARLSRTDQRSAPEVPFYHHRAGRFHRELL